MNILPINLCFSLIAFLEALSSKLLLVLEQSHVPQILA